MENENQESQKELDDIYERNSDENYSSLININLTFIILLVLFICFMLYLIISVSNDISDLKDLKDSVSSSYLSIVGTSIDESISTLKTSRISYIITLIIGFRFGINLIKLTKKVENNILISDVIMKKINYNNKEESKENNKENSKQ